MKVHVFGDSGDGQLGNEGDAGADCDELEEYGEVGGIYHPLTKPRLARSSGLEVATYAMVGGTIMLLPTLPFAWRDMATAGNSAWWSAVYLGLMPSALGFVLWGYTALSMEHDTSLAENDVTLTL